MKPNEFDVRLRRRTTEGWHRVKLDKVVLPPLPPAKVRLTESELAACKLTIIRLVIEGQITIRKWNGR